eukprot:scaffold5522_cov334-Pinguiococcus_pyrenoidosus.AAC.2
MKVLLLYDAKSVLRRLPCPNEELMSSSHLQSIAKLLRRSGADLPTTCEAPGRSLATHQL